MIYHVRNESNLDTSTLCHSGLFWGKCPSRLQAVIRRLPRRVAGSSGISETSPHERGIILLAYVYSSAVRPALSALAQRLPAVAVERTLVSKHRTDGEI